VKVAFGTPLGRYHSSILITCDIVWFPFSCRERLVPVWYANTRREPIWTGDTIRVSAATIVLRVLT